MSSEGDGNRTRNHRIDSVVPCSNATSFKASAYDSKSFNHRTLC